jgi:hypothetical protein
LKKSINSFAFPSTYLSNSLINLAASLISYSLKKSELINVESENEEDCDDETNVSPLVFTKSLNFDTLVGENNSESDYETEHNDTDNNEDTDNTDDDNENIKHRQRNKMIFYTSENEDETMIDAIETFDDEVDFWLDDDEFKIKRCNSDIDGGVQCSDEHDKVSPNLDLICHPSDNNNINDKGFNCTILDSVQTTRWSFHPPVQCYLQDSTNITSDMIIKHNTFNDNNRMCDQTTCSNDLNQDEYSKQLIADNNYEHFIDKIVHLNRMNQKNLGGFEWDLV